MPLFATRTHLLGTVVELRLDGPPEATHDAATRAWATMERLEGVFSTFDKDSELHRWRHGATDEVSDDLVQVLACAEQWSLRSQGAFHPATAALTALWRDAERCGQYPDPHALAHAVPALPYTVINGRLVRTADCSAVDLNAIAKGYIVDRAAQEASGVEQVSSVLINAGGDLRHLGDDAIGVGIEDPFQPIDNAPPRWVVTITGGALATSGSARRGFQIGSTWLGHVLDPRSGYPASHTASVSVIAPTAMDADALATVLGVLEPTQARHFAIAEQAACLIVFADGEIFASPAWPH